MQPLITQDFLRSNFDYDDKQGILIPKTKVAKGTIRDRNGYKFMSLAGRDRALHRLVYTFHKGEIPKGYSVDHIDRNRANNRISNLRLATPLAQAHNRTRNVVINNWNVYEVNDGRKKKFRGAITFKGVKRYIPGQETKEQAQKALKNLHQSLIKTLPGYKDVYETQYIGRGLNKT